MTLSETNSLKRVIFNDSAFTKLKPIKFMKSLLFSSITYPFNISQLPLLVLIIKNYAKCAVPLMVMAAGRKSRKLERLARDKRSSLFYLGISNKDMKTFKTFSTMEENRP